MDKQLSHNPFIEYRKARVGCDKNWENQPIICGNVILRQRKNIILQKKNIEMLVFELSHILMEITNYVYMML